jgi:hypothetical protein
MTATAIDRLPSEWTPWAADIKQEGQAMSYQFNHNDSRETRSWSHSSVLAAVE